MNARAVRVARMCVSFTIVLKYNAHFKIYGDEKCKETHQKRTGKN